MRAAIGCAFCGILAASSTAFAGGGPAPSTYSASAYGRRGQTADYHRRENFTYRNVKSVIERGRGDAAFPTSKSLATSTTNGYRIVAQKGTPAPVQARRNNEMGHNYVLKPGKYLVLDTQGNKVRSFTVHRANKVTAPLSKQATDERLTAEMLVATADIVHAKVGPNLKTTTQILTATSLIAETREDIQALKNSPRYKLLSPSGRKNLDRAAATLDRAEKKLIDRDAKLRKWDTPYHQ